MPESPPIGFLASGIVRVASTLVGIVLLGFSFDRILGLPIWIGRPWQLWGLVPLTLGLVLEAAGTHAFWKHGGGAPNPVAHPSRLVTEGPYAWSRHPLYLARHLILLGAALLLASPSTLALTVLLFIVVETIMIPREEGRLAARFAEPYADYRTRVSKWVTVRRRDRE